MVKEIVKINSHGQKKISPWQLKMVKESVK